MRWVEPKERMPTENGYYITVREWVGDDMLLPWMREDEYFQRGCFPEIEGWEIIKWLDESEP